MDRIGARFMLKSWGIVRGRGLPCCNSDSQARRIRYTVAMAWRRKRKRGWLCWTGVAGCGLLTLLFLLTPRSHWHYTADAARGGDWITKVQADDGRVVLSYEFRRTRTMQELLMYSPMYREDPRFIEPLRTPDLSIDDRRGHLGVPMWLIGTGVAVLGLVPLAWRRNRERPNRVRTAGVCIATIASITAFASPWMGKLSGMHEVGQFAGSACGWKGGSEGLWLWRSDVQSPIPEDDATSRWARSIPLEIYDKYETSNWRGLVWIRTGLSGAFVASTRASTQRSVFDCAFVSWWVAGLVVGVPTFVACWRSRRIETSLACTRCGYDLQGQTANGCPECGQGRAL